jgi:predicted naringenin-chalcone synthase
MLPFTYLPQPFCMSLLVSIGTANPEYGIDQLSIHAFMETLYNANADERKKLKLLYERSGIAQRYSVVPDYNLDLQKRELFAFTHNLEPFPSLEKRMELYHQYAAPLAVKAVNNAFQNQTISLADVTHLITVSCTGMSAPGLDLQLLELLHLPMHTHRTSVNFMGCYAAVHALKIADAIATAQPNAVVVIASVELCTLHFQKTTDYDNLTANALFADGAAACIITGNNVASPKTIKLTGFYSEVFVSGKQDMAWQLSSTGFLMTLSAYIPKLIESNIAAFMDKALAHYELPLADVNAWCIHPGGRKILEALSTQLQLQPNALQHSYAVLKEYGNMSSPTILYVFKKMLEDDSIQGNIVGAAFGPGLTMETFFAQK